MQYFKKSLKIRIGLLESTKGEEEQAEKGKGQRKKNDWQKKRKTEDRATRIPIPSEVEDDRRYNGRKKHDKMTNNDLQSA